MLKKGAKFECPIFKFLDAYFSQTKDNLVIVNAEMETRTPIALSIKSTAIRTQF